MPPIALPPIIMEGQSDLVRESKLETTFHATHTTHIRYGPRSAFGLRPQRIEERWEKSKKLGQGGFGIGWLERCTSGPDMTRVRAVKEIPKG